MSKHPIRTGLRGQSALVRKQFKPSPIEPPKAKQALRTLWRARLNVLGSKDEFLFRGPDEMVESATLAQVLLESSPAAEVMGARIVSVERVAKLWN